MIGPDRKHMREARINDLRVEQAAMRRMHREASRHGNAILLLEIVLVSLGLLAIAWWVVAR